MRKHTRTFKKGIHFPDMKYLAKDKPIEPMPPSEHYFVALSQHIGAPAKPVVEVGATVAAGTDCPRRRDDFRKRIFSRERNGSGNRNEKKQAGRKRSLYPYKERF